MGHEKGTYFYAIRVNTRQTIEDQPAWMKYPADNAGNVGEQVTYGYNGQGTLNSLYSNTASYYYVPQTTYDAAGRMTKRLLGAANLGSAPVLTSSYYYQGWNVQGGRLRMVETKDSQNTLYQRLSYTYDPAGNITAILDGANSSQKQCFAYDNLYRLTSAKVGNNDANCSGSLGSGEYADETYAYDGTTGNLSSKTGMGSYTYDASHKHAVATTSAGGSFSYDANGNMTHRDLPDVLDANTYDYTFDAENRLVQAKKNGSIVATLTYDGDGKRVKAVQGGTTTAFVGGYFEWSGSTSTIVKYYQAGGQTAAMRTGSGSGTSGLRFSLSDHLGSTMLTINADLSGRADQLYKPWGESRYASGALGTKYTYTGQYSYATPSANDFGLMYYRARYYDPLVGRWAQPDSIIPQQSQGVQAWDRYAGMNNNPVRWNDPSGHCIGDDWCTEKSHNTKQPQPSYSGSPIKGAQVQVSIAVGFPIESDSKIALVPILFYSVNFVFDNDYGFQIFGSKRDAEFVTKNGSTSYRAGPAELKEPSHLLSLSTTVAAGFIGGSGFRTTNDYQGRSEDQQLGLGVVQGDYYVGYNEKTGQFDSSYLWGADLGYSWGLPITVGNIALKSDPLFNMPRLGPPPR